MRSFAAVATIAATIANSSIAKNDSDRSFQEICAENAFQYEEHTVYTEDDYILTVFRVPGPEGAAPQGRPPILMQHGILDSANCWVMNYPSMAPAFVAATAGYDVWLGNSRGNTYSLANRKLDPSKNEKKFFDFSWQDMAKDDKAVIDYIIQQTGQEKVAYVGHSMGTTQMFYALATDEDNYKDKLSLFVALGPVTKITHTESELLLFSKNFYDTMNATADLLGLHNLFAANWLTTGAMDLFCTHIDTFCKLMESFFVTNMTDLDDDARFKVYMGHEPNGASVKSMLHYAQNMKTDRFQVWSDDFADLIHPKRETDLIQIENISEVPIAIFAGTHDIIADQTDAHWLRDSLKPETLVHYEDVEAGHLTFLVGKDMTYFQEGVMNLLSQYHPLPSTEFLQ